MIYTDVWLKPDWMQIFIDCKLGGFDERTAVLFIEAGVPHSVVIERMADALHRVQ
jgi:hypothetical protein